MKLVSLIIENIDVYDFLKRNREQIELDHGNQTYRMLQVSLMMDEEAYVRNWLIKNGYMDEEKLPFEAKKPEYQKLPKDFDADAEIDKLAKDNPDAEDPLNLGGKLGTPQYGNLMPGYGNYDTIDRIEKVFKNEIDEFRTEI